MLMSVIDHLDLGAIMQHLRGDEENEDVDNPIYEVENSELQDLTTAESTNTIQEGDKGI